MTHRDPLDFRGLLPVAEVIPPFSFCPSPYRWMLEDNFREVCESENLSIRGPDDPDKSGGWVQEPDRQEELLRHFWARIEPGKSLVFFYCNEGNPLSEDSGSVLVGLGLIREVGNQLYFEAQAGDARRYPVWSRRITHAYPELGFRLPYQEYLSKGLDVSKILCRIPSAARSDFSYIGEHVSDDVGVSIIERLVQSVEAVKDEGRIAGDWERHLKWLNDVLALLWQGRGAFPGTGSVLQYLGMERGTIFQRTLSQRLPEEQSLWARVEGLLDGTSSPGFSGYDHSLAQSRVRWTSLPRTRRVLLSTLSRFELSPNQLRRIADPDSRNAAGLTASDEELTQDPYLIAEQDRGSADSDPVTLETIDHGMRPVGGAARFLRDTDKVGQDDPRRVRATFHAILEEAAASGDSLLHFDDALRRVRSRFPNERQCRPDRDLLEAQADFYQQTLVFQPRSLPPLVGLRLLADAESEVRTVLTRRVPKRNKTPKVEIDWEQLLEQSLGGGKGAILSEEVERRARTEKVQALKTLFECRLSVLTGRAGTGKTSVLDVFLNGLEKSEGRVSILLLAPTGKARVRLSSKTHRNALTIHQLLLKQGWLDPATFSVRRTGGTQASASVVVIDESSMIPLDLLGALFRAIDLNQVQRLVLVGDPNQLPPIGPGRPFVDIITWLEADPVRAKCLATLRERARHETHDSRALALADGFLRESPGAGDDEALAAVSRGEGGEDLDVVFWQDYADLQRLLSAKMVDFLSLDANEEGGYASFNRSLGIDSREWKKAESWQILSPTRGQAFGTDELNRIIQRRYKAGLLRRRGPKVPRPFGEQEIVWTDKVIQIFNRSMKGWPRGRGLDYVANGEIGVVSGTYRGENGDSLDVAYATQPEVTYRYYRSMVDENLELAYALTVHKAQGSDFDTVFVVLPQVATTFSRELVYTGLTRFRKKLVLLIEKDIAPLQALRNPARSDTYLRNSNLFELCLRPEDVGHPFESRLIHRTKTGVLVRSKSEVIVANILTALGISYRYEEALYARDNPRDFRLPDFTVSFEGDTFYWEHLGMLSVPSYRESWERKRGWYASNGFEDRLITSEDGPDGSVDSTKIEETARSRVLAG